MIIMPVFPDNKDKQVNSLGAGWVGLGNLGQTHFLCLELTPFLVVGVTVLSQNV